MTTPKALGTNRNYAAPDLANYANEVFTNHRDTQHKKCVVMTIYIVF